MFIMLWYTYFVDKWETVVLLQIVEPTFLSVEHGEEKEEAIILLMMEEGEPDINEYPSPTQMIEGVPNEHEPEGDYLAITISEIIRELKKQSMM